MSCATTSSPGGGPGASTRRMDRESRRRTGPKPPPACLDQPRAQTLAEKLDRLQAIAGAFEREPLFVQERCETLAQLRIVLDDENLGLFSHGVCVTDSFGLRNLCPASGISLDEHRIE